MKIPCWLVVFSLLLVYHTKTKNRFPSGGSWIGADGSQTWRGDCKGLQRCNHKELGWVARGEKSALSQEGLVEITNFTRCGTPRPGDVVDVLASFLLPHGRSVTLAVLAEVKVVAWEDWRPVHRSRDDYTRRSIYIKVPLEFAKAIESEGSMGLRYSSNDRYRVRLTLALRNPEDIRGEGPRYLETKSLFFSVLDVSRMEAERLVQEHLDRLPPPSWEQEEMEEGY